MKQRLLSLGGLIAPVLFVLMTLLGGALRDGYSHISDTVSELFSPGSPNKLLLDSLHTIYALLLVFFGIGLMQRILRSKKSRAIGRLGAGIFIGVGLLSVAIATVFPQDAWGSRPTFAGEMHILLTGVIGCLSLLSISLIGLWFFCSEVSPAFGIYSLITVGLALLSAIYFYMSIGSPIMGLAERISALIGLLWIFILARWMFSRAGFEKG